MLGLYFHVPFCRSKCDYCDYNSYSGVEYLIGDYLDALEKELAKYKSIQTDEKVSSIYIGGGTPSILDAAMIDRIISAAKTNFTLSDQTEVTIEANPRDISKEVLDEYIQAGINRLSLGIQTFENKLLKILGRDQLAEQAQQAAEIIVNSKLKNFNIDLIYGIPTQSFSQWQSDLETALRFNPDHISIYPLSISHATPLAFKIDEGIVPDIDDDEQAYLYLYATEYLKKNGLAQYEISNFSISGKECTHNLNCWRQGDYLGFGPGAHSHLNGKRWGNTKVINEYLKQVNLQNNPALDIEKLSFETQLSEYIFLRLRLNEGFNVAEIDQKYDIDFQRKYRGILDDLSMRGLIKEGEAVCLTDKGRLLANQVFCEFM